MSARKDQHIAFDRTHATHNVIGPRANVVRQFSAGAAVAKQLPVGAMCMNLHRSETFVLAVVPFDQIAIDFGCGRKAGQFAGASSALQGAREYLRERQSGQPFPKPTGIAFASLGERHIRKPRMLAREAPGGFAVPREIKDWKDFAHTAGSANLTIRVLSRDEFIEHSLASSDL